MTIKLLTCPVTTIVTPQIGEVEIIPNGKTFEMVFDEFETPGTEMCYYTWSYEAYYQGLLLKDSSISKFVSFNDTTK